MGQCGCGDLYPVAAFHIGEGYLIVSEYWGCDYCGTSPSVDLYYFNQEGFDDFCKGMKVITPKPDQYGGLNGRGWQFTQVGKDELLKAVKTLEGEGHETWEEYGSLADYLSDNGRRLIQLAMLERPHFEAEEE